MFRQISVTLNRRKVKTNLVKFESSQPGGPVNFLYVSREADSRLGMPQAIHVNLAPCSPVVLEASPTRPSRNKEQDNATDTTPA